MSENLCFFRWCKNGTLTSIKYKFSKSSDEVTITRVGFFRLISLNFNFLECITNKNSACWTIARTNVIIEGGIQRDFATGQPELEPKLLFQVNKMLKMLN